MAFSDLTHHHFRVSVSHQSLWHGLSYQPARIHRLAGRYTTTLCLSQGLWIWLQKNWSKRWLTLLLRDETDMVTELTGPWPSTRRQRKSAKKSSHWIEDLLARPLIGGEIREHIPSLEGESASTSSHWIEDLQANPSMATKASKRALITLERKSAITSYH